MSDPTATRTGTPRTPPAAGNASPASTTSPATTNSTTTTNSTGSTAGPSSAPETRKAMTTSVSFRLNDEDVQIHVQDSTTPLLQVLRQELGLTGTKSGCAIGYCGACTVLVDGAAVPACLQMVGLLEGREVRTVDGLDGPDGLDPVQSAFVACAGFQCGFCTPGHVMALRALLDREREPSEEQIHRAVDGNYCRCTGYVKILDSAHEAVVRQREADAAEGVR